MRNWLLWIWPFLYFVSLYSILNMWQNQFWKHPIYYSNKMFYALIYSSQYGFLTCEFILVFTANLNWLCFVYIFLGQSLNYIITILQYIYISSFYNMVHSYIRLFLIFISSSLLPTSLFLMSTIFSSKHKKLPLHFELHFSHGVPHLTTASA